MNAGKRLIRKPVSAVLWAAVIALAALLVGMGVSLYHAATGLRSALDAKQKTIAVQTAKVERNEYGSYDFSENDILLYEEDIEYLRSLPQVEAVEFNYLSGAYIESLTAKMGLGNFHGNKSLISRATDTYENCLLTGKAEYSWFVEGDRSYAYDLSAAGGPDRANVETHYAAIRVKSIVSMHPDFPLMPIIGDEENNRYYDGVVIVSVEVLTGGVSLESFFKVGQSYAVYGKYDPSSGKLADAPEEVSFGPHLNVYGTGLCVEEDGTLYNYREVDQENANGYMPSPEHPLIFGVRSMDNRIPIAAVFSGSADELITDPEWKRLAEECEMSLHSFPVLGTNDLSCMFSFINNEVSIVQGRSFTNEEYDQGAKVLILDEGTAIAAGLSVGDTVSLRQFLPTVGHELGNPSVATSLSGTESFNDPSLGKYPFLKDSPHEAEIFTIVGLYRIEDEWKDSLCSFTPNTVFMPQKAQIAGAYGGPSVVAGTGVRVGKGYAFNEDGSFKLDENGFPMPGDGSFEHEYELREPRGACGVYMTIVLKGGKAEEFFERLEADSEFAEIENVIFDGETTHKETKRVCKSGLGGHKFLTFVNGYVAADESVNAIEASAKKLMLLILLSAALLFLIFMLLYQSREKRTVTAMRQIGAREGTARLWLFISGLIVAAVGIVIGLALSGVVLRAASAKLADLTISGTEGAADSAEAEVFRQSIGSSALNLKNTVLIAACGIAAAALALWVQAAAISKRAIRHGGKKLAASAAEGEGEA